MRWKSDKSIGADTFIKTSRLTRKGSASGQDGTMSRLLEMLLRGPRDIRELESAFPGAKRSVSKLLVADLIRIENDNAVLTDEGKEYLKTVL